jgi:CheY-like chemotaxis protein
MDMKWRRSIRKFNKNIKIIAQTAYAMAGERENCIKCRMR